MQYLKPDATRLQRAAFNAYKNDMLDGIIIGTGVVGGIAGLVFSVLLANLWCLLLLLFLLFAVLVDIKYERSTVRIGHKDAGDAILNRAEKYLASIRGNDVDILARPVYLKIFEHAKFHVNDQTECSTCAPRVLALENLLPTALNYQDDSDVRQVLDFLEARKELGE